MADDVSFHPEDEPQRRDVSMLATLAGKELERALRLTVQGIARGLQNTG